jgi:hypothetical protein
MADLLIFIALDLFLCWSGVLVCWAVSLGHVMLVRPELHKVTWYEIGPMGAPVG